MTSQQRPRTVLITGGAGGIGRATGAAFRAAGDTVVLADRDGDRVRDAAETLGVPARTIDTTDNDAIAHGVDAVRAELGRVDVLVNNAGVLSLHGKLLDLAPDDLDTIMATNVSGTFRVTQYVARTMVETGTAGVIVNVSSIGARQPTPGMGGHESSKAAVDAMTRWAAIELAEHDIRVNAVAPGPVLTQMLAEGMPTGSPQRQQWEIRIPLRQ